MEWHLYYTHHFMEQALKLLGTKTTRFAAAGLGIALLASSAVPHSFAAGDSAKKSKASAPAEKQPEVQIIWDGGGNEVSIGSVFHASFPQAMVPVADIGMENKPCPILIQPELPGKWIWKSQTEGIFTVGTPIRPGQKYKLLLIPKLKNLEGAPVESKKPLDERSSREFTVSASFDVGSQNKRPSGGVRFSYPVLASAVAENVWFQDRDNRKRYPVDVVVEEKDPNKPIMNATVSPREDLPKDHTFDLLVEGISEKETGYKLPKFFVFPLGTTEPLKVLKVAAYNRPTEKPGIRIEFNDQVDPSEGSKIRIEPPVEGLKTSVESKALLIEGPFNTKQRYQVTIPAGLTGDRGNAMNAESRWGATFHLKKPAILFPSDQIYRRSRLGFQMPMIQVNTGPLKWRLARVPPEKLHAVEERLREFTEEAKDPLNGESILDPKTGAPTWQPTELLIGASRLETVAEGAIEASPEDVDTTREIAWTPREKLPAGPYVLEITGTNSEGKIIGNRTLISFTDVAVLQKEHENILTLRVTKMTDGSPLAGAKIRAVTAQNWYRLGATTNEQGVTTFRIDELFPSNDSDNAVRWFLIETPEGLVFQPVRGNSYSSNRSYEAQVAEEKAGQFRSTVITDRPIYRPGHTVKFKGIFRITGSHGQLEIPSGKPVSWGFYSSGDEKDPVASGEATLDEFGGFDAEWNIPASIAVDHYSLRVSSGDDEIGSTRINVQEFRPPPFTVELKEAPQSGDMAAIQIKSNYFHGAANAGAKVRWTAVWSRLVPEELEESSSWILADVPREISGQEDDHKVTGEGVLGQDGTLEIKHSQPFTDGYLRGWYLVNWNVDVIGSDAQTVSEPAQTYVYAVPVALLLSGHEVEGPTKGIEFEAKASGTDDKLVNGIPVKVEIYQIVNKSVKEQIAPHVFRYQNSTRHEKVKTLEGLTPFKQTVPVTEPGAYFIGVRHGQNPAVPTVLRRINVSGNSGDNPAEFAQENEAKFEVKSEKETYAVGDKAVLHLEAPYAGVAWVSVEAAGNILDGFEYRMESNAGRFELPIKKEYFPNVWVNVYLMRPGGIDRVPAERFGEVKLVVERPELELKVAPVLASKEARPKGTVSGEITVTSAGQPVADAEITAYAVDESYLVAGGWKPPEFLKAFYLQRNWNVTSFFSNLDRLAEKITKAELTQKGFIIGDGDEDGALGLKKEIRKDFLPLAWWQTGLRTDSKGKVTFSFKAPDSLTRYRVIALAQTKESQFGHGSDTVEVSKTVQIEPALPRFTRTGDSVELRAIVRQKVADSLPVTLRCNSSLTLDGEKSQTQEVKRGIPAVFRFRASVGDLTSAMVHWETDAGPGDSVEMTLPVYPPTLLRKEAVFGLLGKAKPVDDLHKLVPARWGKAVGKADVMLSTSQWLPKISGLPLLLEYPHGCFEQISSRVLAYTALGDLLAYLPDGGTHDAEYRKRVEDGLERMDAALKPDGSLPYWPTDENGSAFPTIAGYWAASYANSNDWEVPSRLLDEMPKAVKAIAEGKSHDKTPFMRCFALMVLSGESEKVDVDKFEPILRDLYLRRETYDEETRAFLAIAMHQYEVLPKEKEQLLREIDRPLQEREFDPESFSSVTRTEAIRAWAFATVHPEENNGIARQAIKKRIEEMLETSQSLSTQENFWLLLAFKTMHEEVQSNARDFQNASPTPTEISKNKLSAAWNHQDIRKVSEFTPRLSGSAAPGDGSSLAGLSCWMDAQFRMESFDLEKDNRTDRGFRVERVVKNLTDPKRTGEASAPYKLGDELLITVRLISKNLHHYVVVEGELPACLETINPNIESVARSYSIPTVEGENQLALSYSELRDKVTCLYFNHIEPGVAVYSVLARVTSAGSFRWPATQAVPMYDARFSGVSAASVVTAVGD